MNQQNICPHGDTNRQLIASLVEESPIRFLKDVLLGIYVFVYVLYTATILGRSDCEYLALLVCLQSCRSVGKGGLLG